MRRGMLGLVLLALLGVMAVPAQAATCSPVSRYTITELEGIGNTFHITRAVAIGPDGSACRVQPGRLAGVPCGEMGCVGQPHGSLLIQQRGLWHLLQRRRRRVAGWAPWRPGGDMVTDTRPCGSPEAPPPQEPST